jgi:hypothetical protein
MGITLRLDGDTVKVGGPMLAREVLRPALTASKPEILDYLRRLVIAPADQDGAGLQLPWGPHLEAHDVRELRAELVGMIEALADLEGWPREQLDEVLTAAVRGPLSALLPDCAHFRERLAEAQAERAARVALRRRTWRATPERLNDRRGK